MASDTAAATAPKRLFRMTKRRAEEILCRDIFWLRCGFTLRTVVEFSDLGIPRDAVNHLRPSLSPKIPRQTSIDAVTYYYYYFIFASQHDPLASPSRGTDTPHCAGGQWRGTGYPWHANGGYGRSSRTRTYVHATAHTRTYMTSATGGTPAR